MTLQEQTRPRQAKKMELRVQALQTKKLVPQVVVVEFDCVSRPSAYCRTHCLDRLEAMLLVLPHRAPKENLDSNWTGAIGMAS